MKRSQLRAVFQVTILVAAVLALGAGSAWPDSACHHGDCDPVACPSPFEGYGSPGSPGLNLSWDGCLASSNQGFTKSSTCSSNIETQKTLYGTYVLPADADAIAGNDIVLDIFTDSSTLPCWWNFTVAPRTTGYRMEFTSACAGVYDYWSSVPGGPTGGSAVQLTPTAASPHIRIKAVVAIDAGQAQPVSASVGEIYSFTLHLKHDATVGTCTGCTTAACIILTMIRVTQVGSPYFELRGPASRQWVKWLGDGVVPAGNNTWGAVKALYR